MKKILFIILIIVLTIPCSAQWRNAKFGDQILAFGVHDTSLFVGSVPYNAQDPLVFRFDISNPGLWDNADNGIDRTQGNINTFASLGSYFFAAPFGHHIYSTTDEGAIWNPVNAASPQCSNGTYLFAELYPSTGPYIIRSSDSGKNWDSVVTIAATSFATNGSNIFARTLDTIWRSKDNGNTWSKISPPFTGTITVMGSLLFIPGNGKLAESTDIGTQWITVAVDSAGVPELVQCLATDGKNLFAGTPTGVLVSTDTGKDWTSQNDSLTYKDISAIGVFDTLLFIDVSNIGLNSEFAAYYRPISELTKADSPASVVQLQSSDSLSIYPNPATGIVTVFIGNQSAFGIQVLNVLGESVVVQSNSGESNITLDLSKLPSGTYFLQIQTANGSVLRKVVVQH